MIYWEIYRTLFVFLLQHLISETDDAWRIRYPVFMLVLNFGIKLWDGQKNEISSLAPSHLYVKYYENFISNPTIRVVGMASLLRKVSEHFVLDFCIMVGYFSATREKPERELHYNQQKIKYVLEILDFFKVYFQDMKDLKSVNQ